MITLYGVFRSRASRNLWLLDELGQDYRHVPVIQAYRLPDAAARGAPLNTRSPAFLSVSPAGAIPVMDDDGFVLTESLAINLYLARKAGGPLAPADAQEDALMVQWSLYGAASVEALALAILYAHGDGRAQTQEGRAGIAATVEALHRPLTVIDGHLAQHGHVVGTRFTVADINLAEILRYAQAEPGLIASFPEIDRWLTECQARSAFRRMWDARMAEPA